MPLTGVYFLPSMDLYHNDTDKGSRPNIPIITMVKVLFLQSMFNMVDEQTETLIRDGV